MSIEDVDGFFPPRNPSVTIYILYPFYNISQTNQDHVYKLSLAIDGAMAVVWKQPAFNKHFPQ